LLNLEMAGYAILPGCLALVAAVLMAPGACWSMSLISPMASGRRIPASAGMAGGLFLILLFADGFLSSAAVLAGVFSALLFLVYSLALFGPAGISMPERDGRYRGWSLCLAAFGLPLAATGLSLAVFDWNNLSFLNAYTLGAAAVLLSISSGRVPESEGDVRLTPAIPAADFYVSSLCVLAAAVAMGSAMTEFQQVWIAMPVLFAMAGLVMLIAAAGTMRVAARRYPWFYRGAACLLALPVLIVPYFILGELTRKVSSDVIAGLGMLDRMGPFWASLTGALTGALLIILARYAHDPAERVRKNWILGFSLYFVAACVWISYLFADLYGIAFAGMGLLGVVGLPVCRRMVRSDRDDSGRKGRLQIGAASFSTLAVAAACLMRVRESVDPDLGLSEVMILVGFLLGAGIACIMGSVVRRRSGKTPAGAGFHFPFMSPDLSSSILFVFFPVFIGGMAGPEMLAGFLPGMATMVVYDVFRIDRHGEAEDAARLNGLMRFAALAMLAAAPLMGL